MTMTATTFIHGLPALRVLPAPERALPEVEAGAAWWERRSSLSRLVGGCPDHWWKPTARTTAACTCSRF